VSQHPTSCWRLRNFCIKIMGCRLLILRLASLLIAVAY